MVRWCLAVGAVLFASCDQPASPGQGAAIPIERLRADALPLTFYSGLTQPQRLVVRDRGAWAAEWAAIWASQSPAPPIREVDFTRSMVVVAALGQRPTGGYSILIDSAAAEPGGVEVTIRTVSPGPRCGVTQALTQPVDVAILPRTDQPVRFVDRSEQNACQ